MEAMAAACSITCTAVSPTNDWITDRRPTEADGVSDGFVLASYHPDNDAYCYMHWSYVGAGVPWRHCSDWQPPTDPEPAPTKPTNMTTNDWITDRPPTAADGDSDGDVVALYHPDADGQGFLLHWSHVGEASPWKRTSIWGLRATPAPQPTKPALAVGQRWRRRDGEIVTIDKIDRNHPWGSTHPFWADRNSYTPEGSACATGELGHPQDLIELLTPRKFKETPRRTVTDFGHVIDAIDEDGVAWWMTPATHDSEPEWHQLTPLPGREVVG